MINIPMLRGKIVEKCGTLTEFAARMGLTPQTMSARMAGKDWKQAEIAKAIKILDIKVEDIPTYFFAADVQ